MKSDARPAADAAERNSAPTPLVTVTRDTNAASAADEPAQADAASASDLPGRAAVAAAATACAQRATSCAVVGAPPRGSRS